ncbi:MAG TPA: NAD(P)H-dependent oxidoreductase [Azoarcus sp.]|nr:NAD(P)H-dependent oxidoreductase [Azoarcus sp.]
MKILQVNASVRVDGSQSTRLANRIVERLTEQHANASVVTRNLAVTPHPALDGRALQALFAAADERTPEQAARVALDDALIEEVKAADTIVLGVPMYNLHIPSQLKNWFDAIARAKVTFEYTENGPKGLLQGKTAYIAATRGGVYRDTPIDTQVPYLKTMLGFLGITDVRVVYVEGLAMGEEAAERAFVQAEADLGRAVAA